MALLNKMCLYYLIVLMNEGLNTKAANGSGWIRAHPHTTFVILVLEADHEEKGPMGACSHLLA